MNYQMEGGRASGEGTNSIVEWNIVSWGVRMCSLSNKQKTSSAKKKKETKPKMKGMLDNYKL